MDGRAGAIFEPSTDGNCDFDIVLGDFAGLDVFEQLVQSDHGFDHVVAVVLVLNKYLLAILRLLELLAIVRAPAVRCCVRLVQAYVG